jgi:hypothetical protein
MKSGSKIETGGETYKALALNHTNLRKNTRAKLVEVLASKKSADYFFQLIQMGSGSPGFYLMAYLFAPTRKTIVMGFPAK